MAVHSNLFLENAQLMYPNFSGRAGTYNAEGERNFKVVIPADMADKLVEDGWLVKCKPPDAEGDPGVCLLEVHLRFDFFPYLGSPGTQLSIANRFLLRSMNMLYATAP